MARIDPLQRTDPADTEHNRDHWSEVGQLLASLYDIVDRLEALFPGRKFTPDGHLVGSIGEVICARLFRLELLPASTPDHDARTRDGRRVQIKFTQGARGVALRAEPDYLLVLRLAPDRFLEVVYNGNGKSPWSQSGSMQRNGQRQISLARLRAIDACVPDSDRLSRLDTVDLDLRVGR